MIRWLFLAALALTPPTAMARPKPASLEARLKRVEDELEIRRIPIAYARALDERNIDAYVALFAKNGEWVNGSIVRKGPAQIRDLLVGLYGASTPPGYVNMQSMEFTTNVDVQIDGDHATAHSQHLLIKRGPDGTPTPVLAGRYVDQLIRENGRWKILRREDHPVLPTAEEWLKVMRAKGSAK